MTEPSEIKSNTIKSNNYVDHSNYSFTDNQKKLIEACEKYSNDPTFVYKYCVDIVHDKPYIVVLQKISDSKNNENRSNALDRNYAKFRANKLLVVEIIDYNHPDVNVDSVVTKFERQGFVTVCTTYKTNTIVEPNNYDDKIDNVCSTGIHYFSTLIPALFYKNVPDHFTGKWYEWNDDGIKIKEYNYVNDMAHDKIYKWHDNGGLKVVENYNVGKREGIWYGFSETGENTWRGKYCSGKQCGKWQYFYKNPLPITYNEYFMNNGKKLGSIQAIKYSDDNILYKTRIGISDKFYSNYEFTQKQMYGSLAAIIGGVGYLALFKRYKLYKYHNIKTK